MRILLFINSILTIFILIVSTIIFGGLLILLSPIDKKRIFLKKLEYYWAKSIILSSFLDIEITGIKNIKNDKYIFCSNHISALDIPLLLSIIRKPIVFLAKKELFSIPFFGWILKSSGMILVDRKNKINAKLSVDNAVNNLRLSNASILIYPEGTRSNDGSLKPFKKGCFILAIKSQIPIIPISIKGINEIMPKNSLFYKSKQKITINIHPEEKTNHLTIDNKELLLNKVYNIIEKGLK